MPEARPLTTADVAELFGVDVKTVARWANEGRLPHFRTPGGHARFWRRDLEPFIATNRRK